MQPKMAWKYTFIQTTLLQLQTNACFNRLVKLSPGMSQTALSMLIWIHDTCIVMEIAYIIICFKLNLVSENMATACDWNPRGRICWPDSTATPSASITHAVATRFRDLIETETWGGGCAPHRLQIVSLPFFGLRYSRKFTSTVFILKIVEGKHHTQITTHNIALTLVIFQKNSICLLRAGIWLLF